MEEKAMPVCLWYLSWRVLDVIMRHSFESLYAFAPSKLYLQPLTLRTRSLSLPLSRSLSLSLSVFQSLPWTERTREHHTPEVALRTAPS